MKKPGRSPRLLDILDFIACIGQEQCLSDMFRRVITEIPRLIPYDQAFAILGDMLSCSNPGYVPTVSMGITEPVKKAYIEYYFKLDVLHASLQNDSTAKTPFFVVDWRKQAYDKNEFVSDFVRKLAHIDICAGIPLFDSHEHSTAVTAVFEVIRSGNVIFASREEQILRFIQPHITNYYSILRRLEQYPQSNYTAAELSEKNRLLSRREAEIAILLYKRLKPNEISTMLMISPRTVEHHIESIYGKLGVRTRKEMLARLFANTKSKRPS